MKNLLFGLIVLVGLFGSASTQEFESRKSGLIDPEDAMSKLSSIVDSLNLQYETCDLNKKFYSTHQTLGVYFSLEGKEAADAKQAIDSGKSYADLLSQFPTIELREDLQLVLENYVNWKDERMIKIFEINLQDGYGIRVENKMTPGFSVADLERGFFYHYYDGSSYAPQSISGFYFPNGFKQSPIKTAYSRMIGYADCLIDTTSAKIKEDAEQGDLMLPTDYRNLAMSEKLNLLDKMRNTRVIGFCSQDERPRQQAFNMAVLAAETTSWEVFLKAHLDIMNDRFERVSDGSYAYAQRMTYIKELEELNIDVIDLLMGITLRFENHSKYHYFGSITRLGRAIAESKDTLAFESTMISMIGDQELDLHNRMVVYFLFQNYTAYLQDEVKQAANEETLARLLLTFPSAMRG
jgi:hypothetical protein